jgi:hypothetical protein
MAASRIIPLIVQIVVFYLVISWLVRLVRRRQQTPHAMPGRETRPKSPPSVSPARSRARPRSRSGGVEHRELVLNGLLWQVTVRPRSDTREKGREVYVDQPPRCPKCRLGVVETESWLGYTWSCPACGRRRRSSKSIEAVAEALARRLR